jgi:hypothetical protein
MIERLARLGYISIGTVYIIAGLLAAAAGLGRGGSTGGQKTALEFILAQPFGVVALGVIGLGLIGYTIWRLVSAVTDSEHRGTNAKGIALRIAGAFRGLIYAGFAVSVIQMIRRHGDSGSDSDTKARHWSAIAMDKPFGRWALAAVGLGIVIYGAYQLYKAWDAKLSKRIHLGEMDAAVRRKVVAVSRFGLAARGIVFFVIGGSLVIAAIRHNPNAARGTSGALQQLPDPLLVAVGVGLAAYGIYAWVNARYRSIKA